VHLQQCKAPCFAKGFAVKKTNPASRKKVE
jgi:hypothetical protein